MYLPFIELIIMVYFTMRQKLFADQHGLMCKRWLRIIFNPHRTLWVHLVLSYQNKTSRTPSPSHIPLLLLVSHFIADGGKSGCKVSNIQERTCYQI